MFRKKRASDAMYDALIEKALNELSVHAIGSEDYVATLDMIDRLYDMKDRKVKHSLSRDTMAAVGGNLLGILMIIKHESVNVIASKALSFVIKPKI